MKSVAFAVVILIFNIMMSGVVGSGIFQTDIHYESEMINRYKDLPQNINESTNDVQQAVASFSILNVIFDTLSWNWIMQFLPSDLRESASWLTTGLNLLSAMIISVGIVEVFWRRNILTGS